MQLSNDLEGRNLLEKTILNFYKDAGERSVANFLRTEDKEWGFLYSHFLVDKIHVIRYGIGSDRGICVGGVELAIGPHYFGPADFWSYKDSERFTLEASTEAIKRNLRLLDEFWGYDS
jgi:hypothetical protein